MSPAADSPTWFCDFNAGSEVDADVLALFVATERSCPANPASVHAAGRRSRAVLEEARSRIGTALGLPASDVLFTSGGTEAANLAVAGLGDPHLPVLLSPAEHPAVLEPALTRGVVWLAVDRDGAAALAQTDRPVGLVSLVHAQSELGTIQPVAEAATLARRLGVPLFVDAAQSLGRVDLAPVVASGAVVALSPHKAHGLRGHGVLAGRDLARHLRPLLRGGSQEHALRPGTQSPALALANALAIERAIVQRAATATAMFGVRAAFLDGFRSTNIDHHLLTPLANSVPNTVMIAFPRVDGRNLLPALDLAGVQASHGSACSSGAPTPPRILGAIGLDDELARACVRFSFAADASRTHMHEGGRRVGDVVGRLQKKK